MDASKPTQAQPAITKNLPLNRHLGSTVAPARRIDATAVVGGM
jgi:hypothetical protein